MEAAVTLRGLGLTTTERPWADGANWLVLAQHRIELSEETIGAAREVMERLTGPAFGEYDGWEAETEPRRWLSFCEEPSQCTFALLPSNGCHQPWGLRCLPKRNDPKGEVTSSSSGNR